MLNQGIVRTLVSDLPDWITPVDITPTPESVMKVVELIPDGHEVPVFFHEDIWDFSKLCPSVKTYQNRINFTRCMPEYKTLLKYYALTLIEKGNNVRGISDRIMTTNTLFQQFITTAGCLELVSDEQILSIIEEKDILNSSKATLLMIVLDVLKCAQECNIVILADAETLQTRFIQYRDIAKHEAHKHSPDIPSDYFDRLITILDGVMRSEEAPIDDRLSAGIILINSQLGLRPMEIPLLKTDCLRYAKTNIGRRPYVVYTTTKSAKGFMGSREIEHICTPLAEKTIIYYLKLRKKCPTANKTDFLYVQTKHEAYPVSKMIVESRYWIVLRKYFPEIARPNTAFNPSLEGSKGNKKLYWFPKLYSFRVHVFSTLENQGLPHTFTEKIMSHSHQSNCDDSYYGGVKTASGPKINHGFKGNHA